MVSVVSMNPLEAIGPDVLIRCWNANRLLLKLNRKQPLASQTGVAGELDRQADPQLSSKAVSQRTTPVSMTDDPALV